ncbi:helix-turn-helix domain-containing protein [Limibacter armeniacum]|uniref:helix-turn-helix domain-containing protein n=1 Tax=Limibacter armeniacum TaxID=466084 RepID=UPI002FE548AC
MLFEYKEPKTGGIFRMYQGEQHLSRHYLRDKDSKLLSLAWNIGKEQEVHIDGIDYPLASNAVLSLVNNQTFHFSKAEDIVLWQFNREFYCILDHDKEVSCAGLLFYNVQQNSFLQLDVQEQKKFEALLTVFIDEYQTADNIQGEMLRMLLKRLIIKITRLLKQQKAVTLKEQEIDVIREFNLLVENHYKEFHQVQDYANMLNRSPKTISNLFVSFSHQTPLQVIQERIILEAKRLLLYTDKTTKEIAFELGFSEVSHFSRFFKKQVSVSPSTFREEKNALSTTEEK